MGERAPWKVGGASIVIMVARDAATLKAGALKARADEASERAILSVCVREQMQL